MCQHFSVLNVIENNGYEKEVKTFKSNRFETKSKKQRPNNLEYDIHVSFMSLYRLNFRKKFFFKNLSPVKISVTPARFVDYWERLVALISVHIPCYLFKMFKFRDYLYKLCIVVDHSICNNFSS